MVKNPPSNAGEEGSIPGQGPKIPHVERRLNSCPTTREKPKGCNERSCMPQLKHEAAKKYPFFNLSLCLGGSPKYL